MLVTPVASTVAAPGPLPAQGDDEARGAAALKDGLWDAPVDDASAAVTTTGPVTPAVGQAPDDQPQVTRERCHHNQKATAVEGCVHGDPDGATRAVLVGSSKAAQWFPAVDAVARREGWRLESYTKSACGFHPGTPAEDYPACDAFNDALLGQLLADPPDLVITAASAQDDPAAFVGPWQQLVDAGVDRVVVVYNSPGPDVVTQPPHVDVLECMAALGPGADYSGCAFTIEDRQTPRLAAAEVSGATYVDLRDWVCPRTSLSPACPPVIGGVLVYRDGSHLTDTFVSTLTDPLHQRLWEAGVAAQPPEPASHLARLSVVGRFLTGLARHCREILLRMS